MLLVVNAWRDRRGGYSTLASATTSLVMTIGSTLPMPPASDDAEHEHASAVDIVEERRHLGRWAVLAFEMAVLKARGYGDAKVAREYLEHTGLLADGEWDIMEPGTREVRASPWVGLDSDRSAL